MPLTYSGVLQDGRVTWDKDGPPSSRVRVLVTLVEESSATEKSGPKMGAILERLAKISGDSLAQSIPDPVAWQKEEREDRPLLGRDE